jgi:hypothetical protein
MCNIFMRHEKYPSVLLRKFMSVVAGFDRNKGAGLPVKGMLKGMV